MPVVYEPEGGEFLVNTTTFNRQTNPAASAFEGGGYVVTWISKNSDGTWSIYSQRYDSAGIAQGGEVLVGTTTSFDSGSFRPDSSPSIAALDDGGYVVVWHMWLPDADDWGVYMQRYDASGAAQGSAALVATGFSASDPTVAALDDGGYVVAWMGAGADFSGAILVQQYDSAGAAVGTTQQVSTTTADQSSPSIAGLDGGGYVVTWSAYDSFDGHDIYVQRYNASGFPEGGEIRVTPTTEGVIPSVAALDGGGFVVAWMAADGSGQGIYAQRYDASGVPQGGEFRVNTTTADSQGYPSVAGLEGGGFVVTWESYQQDGSLYGIYAQRYDASGVADGGESIVNTTTADSQQQPAVIGLAGGGYVITWTSLDSSVEGIYAQQFAEVFVNAEPVGGDETVVLDEDGSYTFTSADFNFSDTDGNGFAGVVITTLPTDGSLTLSGAAVGAGDFISAADIAAGNLMFMPDANENGTGYATFTFQVRDDGGTADGGQDTDQTPNTMALDVTAVNDTPVVTIAPGTNVSIGGETQVNTTTLDLQQLPSVAPLADGGYVVTWQSHSPDANYYDVRAQIYDVSGTPQGEEFLVNTTVVQGQQNPAVAALPDGGFIIVWDSQAQDGEGYGIYYRQYDDTGSPITGEILVNATTASSQSQPAITVLKDGGYVITWMSYSQDAANSYGIYMQRYDANGVAQGSETGVNTTTADHQKYQDIASLADGGYIVTWVSSNQDGSFDGVYAQQYDSTGSAVGSEFRVNTTTQGSQTLPSVTGLGDGGYVIVWQTSLGTFAQRYDADGLAQGGEVQVNTTGGASYSPDVSALEDGGYIVTWTGYTSDGGYEIFAQRFSAAGVAVGPEFIVNETNEGDQSSASVTGLSDGGYVIAWDGLDSDSGGIFAQQLDSAFLATEQSALNLKGSMSIADVDAGGATVTATLSVDYGILNVTAGTSGALVSGSGTSTVTITGTIAQINDLLGNNATSTVTYTADSDAPPASATLTLSVDDGGNTGSGGTQIGSASETIVITPVDDGAAAQDDAFATAEDGIATGNVLADNGSGADTDPDGPLTVTAVNGDSAAVGQQITLTSGALLTLNSDGTFSYDPNGAFDHLPGPDSGASNTSATDSFTYSLADGSTATVTVTVNGTSAGDDTLEGTAGNDSLDGGIGADTMSGGGGDDSYTVENIGDVVTENVGEGFDWVYSDVTYTLAANVENLTLTGSDAIDGTGNSLDNRLAGNSAANVLTGGGGDDKLNGGAGADTMIGGNGNDIYVVENAGDVVIEQSGQGKDQVVSSISYVLPDNVEQLILAGNAPISGTGNSGANLLIGNSAANLLSGGDGKDTLDGGAGADTMAGGAGNDSYFVDDAGDVITENLGEGNDRVYSSVTYTLADNVENLTLTGSAAINGTGNALNNWLVGNSAANVLTGGDGKDRLDGGAGDDTLVGGTGDDIYVVDSLGDSTIEAADEGKDSVHSKLSWTLGDHLDKLFLLGSDNLDGTGNALRNTIYGNSGDNILSGLAGLDKLFGGSGNDTLNGGNGADYLFGEDGDDVIRGGSARDVLSGGAGADEFVFADGDFGGLTAKLADKITDFSQAELDKIRLDEIDADSSLEGDQAFTFVGTAAFTNTAGELRYEIVDGNTHVYGDTNGDGVADFMILLTGSHALTEGDFVI